MSHEKRKTLPQIVQKIFSESDLEVDPSGDKWDSRIGRLLGTDVLDALKAVTKSGRELGDRDYWKIIKILDAASDRRDKCGLQPHPGVLHEFVRAAGSSAEPKGSFKLLSNGSIVRSPSAGYAARAPLLVRPYMMFPKGGICFADLRTAEYFRERMKSIMREVERRENFRTFLECDEVL